MDYDMFTRAKPLLARYVPIVVSDMLIGGVSQCDYGRLHRESAAVREKNIAPRSLYSRAYYLLLAGKMALVLQIRRLFGEKAL
jgi:hypothetical protein